VYSQEISNILNLALANKDVDLRLYLGKLIREKRQSEPEFAKTLEDALKNTAGNNSSRVLRKAMDTGTDGINVIQEDYIPTFLKYRDCRENKNKPILNERLKRLFSLILAERSNSDVLLSKGLAPTRSVFFTGPPGVGKTMSATWLASMLHLPLYELDLTTVMSSLLGKSGSNLREAIDFAKGRPCVLLLDEFDAIAKTRADNSDVGELKRLVTILLQEIENWPAHGLLIAATNHPEIIDAAIWRRFDSTLQFSKPSEEQIKQTVIESLGDDLTQFSEWVDIISFTQKGQSFSHIKKLVHKLRKYKLIEPQFFEDEVAAMLINDDTFSTKKDQIQFGITLVENFKFTKQKAAQLANVSRETLRKHMDIA